MRFVALLLLVPAIAAAEDERTIRLQQLGFVSEVKIDGTATARQVLPASTSIIALPEFGSNLALAQSRIIYLNRNSVTLRPGDSDSRINTSTLVTQATAFTGWTVSATTWNETVTCMRGLFARFDVTVVDTDPGNVPHMEAVFGGTPTQLGLDSNVAGVSPFTLDCSIIENSIVFVFAGAFQLTAKDACEYMAQEVAHSYGLDHELLASDPMTYLAYNGNRAFQDQAASCGESTARPCGINGSTCRANQNSVALLRDRLGTADAIAPTVNWGSPANNSTVPPGFEVKASATDNIAVTGAVLQIDGQVAEMLTGAGPFTFITSAMLANGPHDLVVQISDGKNLKSETRSVTVQLGAPPPGGDQTGTGSDSGEDAEALANGDIVGGCSTGGGGPCGVLALAWVGLLARRRRRW